MKDHDTPEEGANNVMILETSRLVLRKLTEQDAAFIFALLNDAAWLRYIGDKKVHSLEDARAYIRDGPMSSYERNGFGLWLVESKENHIPVGMCGLIKRDSLEDVDIGFAYLPEFRGKGYGFEAASAVMAHGKNVLGLRKIVAIVSPGNSNSIGLLEKLGLKFEKTLPASKDAPPLLLYA